MASTIPVISAEWLGTCAILAASYRTPQGRHLEGANYAFTAGHVKWLKGASVSPGYAPIKSTDLQQNGQIAAGTENSRFAATFSPM